MRAVLFTKLFGKRHPDQIAQVAVELGFDGIDLLIREGFSATPDDPDSIRRNAEVFAAAGVPVLTATTDLTSPAQAPAGAVFEQCAAAGISTVRLGYWPYSEDRGYRALLDQARADLDELERVSAEFGVTLLVQLHGGTIHSSGALAAQLLDGRNPEVFGTYIDPGNQAVQDGREDWRLTLDLLGDRLRCVGVKNGAWAAGGLAASGQRQWAADWCGVADGMVPWDEILQRLSRDGYAGLLSFHGHYELPYEHVVDQTRTDLRYVRRVLAGAA